MSGLYQAFGPPEAICPDCLSGHISASKSRKIAQKRPKRLKSASNTSPSLLQVFWTLGASLEPAYARILYWTAESAVDEQCSTRRRENNLSGLYEASETEGPQCPDSCIGRCPKFWPFCPDKIRHRPSQEVDLVRIECEAFGGIVGGPALSRSGSLARARLNSRIEICHVYRSAVTNLVASVQHCSLVSNPEPYSSSSCEVSSLG